MKIKYAQQPFQKKLNKKKEYKNIQEVFFKQQDTHRHIETTNINISDKHKYKT
jgi:hypothetical protein